MTAPGDFPVPLADCLPGVLGIELVETSPERVVGRLRVEDRVRQPFGLLHGGAILAMAETLASLGTYQAVVGDGYAAAGQEISGSLLRTVSDGVVGMEALPVHRGRRAWIWQCEARRDDGELCAVCRCTIAVVAPRERALRSR